MEYPSVFHHVAVFWVISDGIGDLVGENIIRVILRHGDSVSTTALKLSALCAAAIKQRIKRID